MTGNETTKNRISVSAIAEMLFLLFAFLKPFYIFPSGNIGPADLCLALSAVLLLADSVNASLTTRHRSAPAADSAVSAPHRLIRTIFYREDTFWYIFLAFVIIINGYYFVTENTANFLLYTAFWCYNGAAIWTYRRLRASMKMPTAPVDCTAAHSAKSSDCTAASIAKASDDSAFPARFSAVLTFNILIQFVILISGHGRYFVEYWGATRFMGTFNDPNQLAFSMFVSALLIYKMYIESHVFKMPSASSAISVHYGSSAFQSQERSVSPAASSAISGHSVPAAFSFLKKAEAMAALQVAAAFILATVIIVASKSTGIMLGMGAFYVLICACTVKTAYDNTRSRGFRAAIIVFCAAVLILGAVILAMIWPPADFDVKTVDYNILTRIQEKLWKVSHGGLVGIILDRGADRILAYPQYVFLGAGEGGFTRFPAEWIVEIHSCLFSILFCYGIIPTICMLAWFREQLSRFNRWQLCAAAALIIECMLLINYRQPLFWFVFI